MIEVNLLPGGKKGKRGGGFAFKLPSFSAGGMPDPYILFAVGAGIVALGYMGWAFMGVRAAGEELQLELDQALEDSVRFAAQIEQTNALLERRNSIAERVEIIQEIDAERYIWPHILDEIARAVPEYTWLSQILYQSLDPLEIRIIGYAGSIPAVTAFMDGLEASRFLRLVQPESITQSVSQVNNQDLIYEFQLTMSYDQPPFDELETVPLFQDGIAAQVATPDTTTGN